MVAGRKTGLVVSAALLTCASLALASGDHSLVEFPRLNGELDDSPRFQRAVDACRGGGLLSVPAGEYSLSRTLFVTNLCSVELSPGARIRAVAEIELIAGYAEVVG